MTKWKSIMQPSNQICFLCKKRNVRLEKHHIMNGIAYRDKAEEDGLYVMLCTTHFEPINGKDIQVEGCHEHVTVNPKDNQKLKKSAQRAYMLYYHKNLDQWIKRYGKSYEDDSSN